VMAKEVVAGKSAAVESTVLCCGFSHVQPEHRDHQTRSPGRFIIQGKLLGLGFFLILFSPFDTGSRSVFVVCLFALLGCDASLNDSERYGRKTRRLCRSPPH
jgi:hypothetical protein